MISLRRRSRSTVLTLGMRDQPSSKYSLDTQPPLKTRILRYIKRTVTHPRIFRNTLSPCPHTLTLCSSQSVSSPKEINQTYCNEVEHQCDVISCVCIKVLLVTSSFMSPSESRGNSNLNRVRFFGPQQLVKSTSQEKWDRVKIVCTQPYSKVTHVSLSLPVFLYLSVSLLVSVSLCLFLCVIVVIVCVCRTLRMEWHL